MMDVMDHFAHLYEIHNEVKIQSNLPATHIYMTDKI